MSEEKQTEKKIDPKDNPDGIDYSKFSFADAAKKVKQIESKNRMKEANRLKHVIITCNNPNKRSYEGDIFCVRNSFIEPIKKFVPFGKETHVPQIMLNMIREKRCQMFKEERVNGHKVIRPYTIPEYSIEELPPITPEQFEAIKQHQLAEGKIGA